jgi:murein DD-endopeptidase MepM/ murein hydrolase activator NlpD
LAITQASTTERQQGTNVVAAQDGRVLEVSQRVSWGESYGTAIIVLHRDMTRAIYAHLSKTMVGRNQEFALVTRSVR